MRGWARSGVVCGFCGFERAGTTKSEVRNALRIALLRGGVVGFGEK